MPTYGVSVRCNLVNGVIPGGGFDGATATPSAVGDPEALGYAQSVIAPVADFVPYQTHSADFNIGAPAFHIDGMNRVELSIGGGPWTPVTTMTANADTGAMEFTFPIVISRFADGLHEARMILYPESGVPKVISGIYFNTNRDGTLDETYIYINSASGNDTTGNGTALTPWATIDKAARTAGAARVTIRCAAGTYNWPELFNNVTTTNGWLTLEPAVGVDRDEVIVMNALDGEEVGGFSVSLVHIKNITMGDGATDTRLLHAGAAVNPRLWLDNVEYVGPSPEDSRIDSVVAGFSGIYYTDCLVHGTTAQVRAGILCRNVEYHTGCVAYSNPLLLVNCTAANLYIPVDHPDNPHTDVVQNFGGTGNQILYGLTTSGTIEAQGIISGDVVDQAIVNCVIANNAISGFSCSRTATHLYIKNSSFDSPISGWLSNGGSPAAPGEFVATAVVLEDSTFTGTDMSYLGVTIR